MSKRVYPPPPALGDRIGDGLVAGMEWVTDAAYFALGAWVMPDPVLWRRRWWQAADALWFGAWGARR